MTCDRRSNGNYITEGKHGNITWYERSNQMDVEITTPRIGKEPWKYLLGSAVHLSLEELQESR